MDFVAIDFETATFDKSSACAIGIVTVENSIIVEEYYTLIRPPHNQYFWRNIQVHGIQPHETEHEADFDFLFPEIYNRLEGRTLVAHNESFDRNVLKGTMAYYGLDYDAHQLPFRWECTCKIYRRKGYKPASLNACCSRKGIELNHHHALSDAIGCAKLYMMQ